MTKLVGSLSRFHNPSLLASAAVVALLALPMQAQAAGTIAGSTISNTATATYDDGSGPTSVNSNQVDLLVDELLDVTVASDDPADVVTTPGATGQLLTYTVTNTGNGNESFTLSTVNTVGGDDYNPNVTQIYLDNGDGVFDAATDTLYVPGTNDPNLAPDTDITVFVLSSTPTGLADGDRGIVQLVAEANTGTGAPGTSFTGAGQGGGDAVVGTTGADGSDEGAYVVSTATVSLVKSATVADPFGGTEAVPGSIITYTITATVTGSGSVNGVTISDNIPADTTYVPGTITLGGSPLTDSAADADAGSFGSNAVTVNLGTVAGGQTRTVTFQSKID